MSYETAVASMFALGHELAQTPSHKFDLGHMRVLLEAMDHPERSFPCVLIAGTNGKGSTAATLASILQASGLRTGLYTSPHLIRINERIRVNREEIRDDDFAGLHGEVDLVAARLVEQGGLPWHPSFFEMMTAIAFAHFARQRVELAVLEVGIGGVVVTLPQLPEANHVIGNTILDLGARAVSAVEYVPPLSPGSSGYLVSGTETQFLTTEHAEKAPAPYGYEYPLQVMGKQILVHTPLLGRHQLRNVALAVAAAEQLNHQGFAGIGPQAIERGIRETRWPGRFQVIAARAAWPEIVLDVAHNPAGAWALRSALSERYDNRPLVFVFGAMRDKAISEMTEILFPLAQRVIATRPENPRAASPEEIRQAGSRTGAEMETVPETGAALARARELAGPGTVMVVTGSIYLVGEAMRVLGVRT
jgi:dihydrofolate synthase/folylpolyglutamate synthase